MIALAPGAGFPAAALGAALLHFLWQGTLVGALHALLRGMLPRDASEARYALGLLALLMLAVLPIGTFLFLVGATAPASLLGESVALPRGALLPEVLAAGPLSAGLEQAGLLHWVVVPWLAGVSLLSLRALAQWLALQGLLRRHACVDAELDRVLARLEVLFASPRRLAVFVCERIDTPMLVGWLKPVILLPPAVAFGFPRAQLELVLAHELGHLRRLDHLANLLQTLIETLLFYHPVVHWISREVRAERELCCDRLVLARTGEAPRVYARVLEALETSRFSPLPLGVAATGGALLDRVRRLVGEAGVERQPARRLAVAAIAAFLALACWQDGREAAPAWLDGPLAWQGSSARFTLAVEDIEPVVAPDPVVLATPRARLAGMQPVERAPEGREPSARHAASSGRLQRPAPAPASSAPAGAPPPDALPAEVAVPPPPVRVADTRGPAAMPAAALASPLRSPLASAVSGSMPVIIEARRPDLSRGIRGAGEERVELNFTVAADGSVRDIRIAEASQRHAQLERAARSALAAWRFDPGTIQPGAGYRQAFVFSGGGQTRGGACVRVTGSMLCRQGWKPEARPDGHPVLLGGHPPARMVAGG